MVKFHFYVLKLVTKSFDYAFIYATNNNYCSILSFIIFLFAISIANNKVYLGIYKSNIQIFISKIRC